ncbi:T9SS type A sorting domain-containing protein [Hugenholtzia roseola]|uniref:T9SS type A sorting domain-containing protein n=1 Tax=Hugenholtzia roseola TaxID=1002 RepID=UPI000400F46A|nr:T9SS type A sorting domain-containing protein [Hugenholtzia roseola]
MIADAGDSSYDSGVFIEKVTSNDINTTVNASQVWAGCTDPIITYNRTGSTVNPLTLTFQFAGSAVNGVQYTTSLGGGNTLTFGAGVPTVNMTITPNYNNITQLDSVIIRRVQPCTGQPYDSMVVYLSPLPDLGPDLIICKGDSVLMGVGKYVTYEWQNSSNTIISTDSATWLKAGTYRVFVENEGGCRVSDTLVINYSTLEVNATVSCGGIGSTGQTAVILQATGGTGGYQYCNLTLATAHTTNNTFFIDNNTTHDFEVIDSQGCRDTVFNVAAPNINDAIPSNDQIGACLVPGVNAWLSIADPNEDMILAINDNGVNMGIVQAGVTIEPSLPYYDGEPYIRRHYNVTPTSNGLTTIRLYFTEAEYQELLAANPSAAGYNLAVDRYPASYGAPYRPAGEYLGGSVVTNFLTGIHYIEIDVLDFDGSSNFYIHSAEGGDLLPIDLVFFRAQTDNEKVLLHWEVTPQSDAVFFEVERKQDRVAFAPVGKVVAQNQVLRYQWADQVPLSDQIFYYRLKMKDQAGTIFYSPVVEIKSGVPSDAFLQIAPNPFAENTQVLLFLPQAETIWVQLQDMEGKTLYQVQQNLAAGRQNLAIPTQKLASGMFLLKIQTQTQTFIKKLIKN